ncbi:oligosaccharide flippase family protein [Haloplanus sp. C73]|uniref:oligosaccharide flippase family protein n=1 Tax=Haloplanus sp. C73 TaxID=3421641 RepID=UPI003EB77A64
MGNREASDVSLGGETTKATLAKFTMAAAGFVGTIVFARLLGPFGIGGYYLLMTVIQVSNTPINGLSAAVQKRLSESNFEGAEAMTIATLVALVWTGIGVASAYLFRERFAAFVGFSEPVLAFGILMGALNLFSLYQGALSATGQIGRTRWIDAFRSYLTLPAQLVLVWIGLGAAGMAYGEAVATLLLLAPLLNSTANFSQPTWATAKSLWEYAKYSIPNRYLSRMYDELDILILGLLLTEGAAGHYGVAFRLSLPGMYIAMVASSGLFSRVSNLSSKNEPITDDIRNTLAFTSLFAIPMLFGGTILNKEIVTTLYGSEFKPAALLLTGLLFYQLIRTQSTPLERVVGGLDRPDVVTRVYLVLFVVNVVVGVGLTYLLGAIGVVLATILAETIRYVALLVHLHQEGLGIPLLQRPIIEQIFSGLVMGAALIGLKSFVPISSWFVLGCLVATGAITYFGVLFVASDQFRNTVFDSLDDIYPTWRDLM